MSTTSNIFTDTLSCFRSSKTINELITDFKDQIKVKIFKGMALNPQILIKRYLLLQNKYQKGTLPSKTHQWHEGEKKLFLWFIIAYRHLHYKRITEITQNQWNEISSGFFNKSITFMKFEARIAQKNSERVHWQPQQQKLLQNLANGELNGRWSEISKAIFQQSQGEYFKTTKQCRQHWSNHLNKVVKKGGWTIDEDIVILNFVLQHGRHWSKIVSLLGGVRTEHMIKNRYSTILNIGRKYCGIIEENNNLSNNVISVLIQNLNKNRSVIYEISQSNSSDSSVHNRAGLDRSEGQASIWNKQIHLQQQAICEEKALEKKESNRLTSLDLKQQEKAKNYEIKQELPKNRFLLKDFNISSQQLSEVRIIRNESENYNFSSNNNLLTPLFPVPTHSMMPYFYFMNPLTITGTNIQLQTLSAIKQQGDHNHH